MQEFNVKTEDELFIHLGSGKITVKSFFEVIPSLKPKDEIKEVKEVKSLYSKISHTATKTSKNDNAIIVDGASDVLVRMAKCCNPIPGDPIMGVITRGRGITIHNIQCKRLTDLEATRQIAVQWNSEYTFKHPVNVRVLTHDRPGILSSISKNITNNGINIRSAIAKSLPDDKGSFIFEIEVKDYSELLKTISAIESMESVISVQRA